MSAYAEVSTVLTEQAYLLEALRHLGFNPTIHATPIHLKGHRNDTRPEVAHIVIPRAQIGGASNDIGFVMKDGQYRAIISDFDRLAKGYNDEWLGNLSQLYKEKECIAIAGQYGLVLDHRTVNEDGTVELKFFMLE